MSWGLEGVEKGVLHCLWADAHRRVMVFLFPFFFLPHWFQAGTAEAQAPQKDHPLSLQHQEIRQNCTQISQNFLQC